MTDPPDSFKTDNTRIHYEAHITWLSGKKEIVQDWGLRSFWTYVESMRQWTEKIAEVVPYEITVTRRRMPDPARREAE